MKNFFWLLYKRTRVAVAFAGFVIMYSLVTGLFATNFFDVLLISLSVFFVELFGVCYNDYHDFDEDLLNNRTDKLTVNKVMTPAQMKAMSILFLFGSLLGAFYSGTLPPIVIYILMAFMYSNPRVRLKKYNIKGYLVVSSIWFLIPVYLGFVFQGTVKLIDVLFALFFFFQYSYLLSQKDSTDPHDRTNLFIEMGWKNAVNICAILAFFSIVSLFLLSFPFTIFLLVWGMNLSVKFFQTKRTYAKKINRGLRSKLILMEFLTPYLFTLGTIL